MNQITQLSPHFSLAELTASTKAAQLGIDNTPAAEIIPRLIMVAEMLDRFNMVAKKDLFPEQLSGGQQQLVGIARAIVGEPKLLLADEPTGNLHSDQGKQIMEIFKKLNDEGITIIQVTHSEENARYGKRIVRVADGAIAADELVN